MTLSGRLPKSTRGAIVVLTSCGHFSTPAKRQSDGLLKPAIPAIMKLGSGKLRILSQESDNPYGAVELVIMLHDCGSDMNVWSLDVEGEERVFFEVPEDADALDLVELAFEARKGCKNG